MCVEGRNFHGKALNQRQKNKNVCNMSGKGTLALRLLLDKELSLFPFPCLTLTGQWKTICFVKSSSLHLFPTS